MPKIVFKGFEISNFCGEACPQTPTPPSKKGLLYSNLTATSDFIETPDNNNYYNDNEEKRGNYDHFLAVLMSG